MQCCHRVSYNVCTGYVVFHGGGVKVKVKLLLFFSKKNFVSALVPSFRNPF